MWDLLIAIYTGVVMIVIGLLLTILRKQRDLAFSFLGGGAFLAILGLFTRFLLTRN
jgi:hypothetical protein